MKRKIQMLAACLCHCLGILVSFYVGGWLMFLQPILNGIEAFASGTMTWSLLIVSIVKIICASTLAGLIWCIGYIGRNHFVGRYEPDWEPFETKQKV